jgi:hypothetical protein
MPHAARLVGVGALPPLQVLDVALAVPLGASHVACRRGLAGAACLTWCGESCDRVSSDLVTSDVPCQERLDTPEPPSSSRARPGGCAAARTLTKTMSATAGGYRCQIYQDVCPRNQQFARTLARALSGMWQSEFSAAFTGSPMKRAKRHGRGCVGRRARVCPPAGGRAPRHAGDRRAHGHAHTEPHARRRRRRRGGGTLGGDDPARSTSAASSRTLRTAQLARRHTREA